MHNIDRTQAEWNKGMAGEAQEWEFGHEFGHEFGQHEASHETGQHEYGHELSHEFGHELSGELAHEFESEFAGELAHEMGHETAGAHEFEGESPAHETLEMALASELLEVNSEAELEQFIGRAFRRISRTIGRVIPAPILRAASGALRAAARRLLPIAGGALGSLIAPGVGTLIGSNLASAAGQMFGLEMEGMSSEDREFEVARRFVRLMTDTLNNAARSPGGISPQSVAQSALATAAQRYAPGLLAGQQAGTAPAGSLARRVTLGGRWFRTRRGYIILVPRGMRLP